MMRNNEKSGTELVASLFDILSRELPDGWEFTQRSAAKRRTAHFFTKEFQVSAPDGTQAIITAVVRNNLTPASATTTINWIAEDTNSPSQTYVVIAPFISPRSQELLRAAGIDWFDPSGNIDITMNQPALVYKRIGKDRSPETQPEDRRLKSLKGPKAARVVRTLLDTDEKIGVRELAIKSGVGSATSARVIEYLDREKLVSRDARGSVTDTQKEALLRAWTRDYRVTTSNRVITGISARGIDNVLTLLPESGLRYAITGSATTDVYLPAGSFPAAPTTLLMVYVDDVAAAQKTLKVRSSKSGINVFLIEPFDDIVYQGAQTINGLQYVAPSQAIADLLTAPGRSDEEAQQLLEEIPIS